MFDLSPRRPAAPPPHHPPEPCSDRSPLIVPDELLHFPANVRRGDLRRPGGVISTHSLGCRQHRRCQEPAWIAQSADRSAHTAPGRPRRLGPTPLAGPVALHPGPPFPGGWMLSPHQFELGPGRGVPSRTACVCAGWGCGPFPAGGGAGRPT